jgi:hypothetical protein
MTLGPSITLSQPDLLLPHLVPALLPAAKSSSLLPSVPRIFLSPTPVVDHQRLPTSRLPTQVVSS